MKRNPIYVNQEDRFLLKSVIRPKIEIKMSDVDKYGLNDQVVSILGCPSCGHLAIDAMSCYDCLKLVCKQCQTVGAEGKPQCPSCNQTLKPPKKQELEIYDAL
jgi:hypothetical protein